MGTSADEAVPVVRLLGTVELTTCSPGRVAPRERALLARLAMDVGRPVSTDRLVDDLWPQDPPPSARNALQVYVSHLRARLGRPAVASSRAGYLLDLDPDAVDSHRMERLVAAAVGLAGTGRTAEAVETLDEAGGLWRGDPLAGLDTYDFARVEAARLIDVRATALEQLAEALLALGHLDRLTDDLLAWVRFFPYRERLRAAVMTGLYRQGRAVDALTLYAEVVDLLREELGLEPGPTLKALQQAILRDDTSLLATLPAGELTLFATVLDESTTLEARLGEAYGDALLAHRDRVREALTTYGGSVVPSDPERLLGVFTDATAAVRAAAAVQRGLDDVTVCTTPLRVRVGVHTGRPRVVDQHYVGVEVHRVVSVAAAAWGGQVLVTDETVRRLDTEALAEAGVVLRDVGRHRLPDVVQLQRIHQLDIRGAASDFPPPRSIGGRGNLPRTAVPLIGRETDLQDLLHHAQEPGSGLCTVVGAGGTGKTRIAVEVASLLPASAADEIHFVPLEAVADPRGVWAALSAALDLPAEAGAAAVTERLAGRRTFLVLDNLEQVRDVGEVVEALLGLPGEVRVLATSRRPTGVTGERLRQLEPLSDEVTDAASTLFASCAALARPGFVLDRDNRDAVADICRRLDGLPLAIVLAAARTRHLAPRALADQLATGLDLVSGGATWPARQRSLRALTAWSYDLLTRHEQEMLQDLSVFVGGVDVEALPGLGTEADPVATVLELCDASLVRITGADDPRVTMLESVREFARERLEESGRLDTARERHLRAHVLLARRMHPRVTGAGRAAELVGRDRANFEAAIDWALACGGPAVDAAAEIIVGLGATWHQLGPRSFERIARTAAALQPSSPHAGWVAYWDYRRLWDTVTDDQVLLEALAGVEARLRAVGDPAPLAALLAYGTNLGPDAGLDPSWGVRRSEEAVGLARALGDDWLLETCLSSFTTALVDAGRPAEAHAPLVEARRLAARRGDDQRIDSLTLVEAQLLAESGRRAEAWAAATRAAQGLVTTRSDGMLWHAADRLARLCPLERPASAAVLSGIAFGALDRMGSIPGPLDLARHRADLRDAVEALGDDEFDRLAADARRWSAEDAIAWVHDLIRETTPG